MINFNKLITKHIEEEFNKDDWGKDDTDLTYHPSYIGYCDRYMLTAKAGLREINRTLKGIFYQGKEHHKLFQELPLRYGIVESDEGKVEVPVKYKVPGSDIVIIGSVDYFHDGVVYDFKTTDNKWTVEKLNFVKKHHKLQVHLYMYPLKAAKGSVVYVHKGTLLSRQFIFDYEKKLVEDTFERLKKFHPIYMKWKNNGMKIEEIPFKKCGCNYCTYEVLNKSCIENI